MIEEIQLLEAVERYVLGEMPADERAVFEQLRKNNPELDQMVVEHMIFLHQLNDLQDRRALRNVMNDVQAHLEQEGVIKRKATKAVVRELWRKYKRVMAVAASIAGITALTVAAVATYYNRQASRKDLEDLKRSFTKEVDQKKRDILTEVDKKIPKTPNVAPKSGGTGFLIDGKGYLVTNAHVIRGANSVFVQNNRGDLFRVSILNINQDADLAILKIDDEDFKPVSSLPYSINKNTVDLGEALFTLGYPRNEIVYNEGYMSAKTGYNGDTLSFQIGVSANPGNSGGPVFNKNGEVIGIITTRQTEAEGVVFAVTAKNIYRTLDEMRKEDSSARIVKISNSSQLKGIDRPQQIKKIEDFVYMVKSY